MTVTTETITTELLDEIELYLNDRVDINVDGMANKAMSLLMEIQRQRENWIENL